MGKLYGIGVGPGDPELLTLKAYKILQQADVIFCPEKKKGAGSFAFDIIKEHIKDSKAQIVNLEYPMHYHGDELKKMWQENGRLIAEYLKGEKTGAFITLGDPSVYSTFMYTLPYIEAFGTETEVIPGIPSFCAAAAISRTPLTAWDEDLVIAPVRKNSPEDLTKLLTEHDNVVFMKPSSDKEALLTAIKESGKENSFVLVEKAGTKEQRLIRDYKELKENDVPYLSLMILKAGKQ